MVQPRGRAAVRAPARLYHGSHANGGVSGLLISRSGWKTKVSFKGRSRVSTRLHRSKLLASVSKKLSGAVAPSSTQEPSGFRVPKRSPSIQLTLGQTPTIFQTPSIFLYVCWTKP